MIVDEEVKKQGKDTDQKDQDDESYGEEDEDDDPYGDEDSEPADEDEKQMMKRLAQESDDEQELQAN